MTFPRLLRPEDVAELLSVSRAAVYAMAYRGELPGVVKIGRRVRFDEAAVGAWLEGLRAEARPPVLGPRVLPSWAAKRDAIAEGGKR